MEVIKRRPVGVTILAILMGIQGSLQIIYGFLALLAVPGYATTYGNAGALVAITLWGFLISGAILLALAYGLWTLKSWAFWTTVFLEGLNLIVGIISMFTSYYPWAVLLSLIIPAVILIYLLVDNNVRSAFGVNI